MNPLRNFVLVFQSEEVVIFLIILMSAFSGFNNFCQSFFFTIIFYIFVLYINNILGLSFMDTCLLIISPHEDICSGTNALSHKDTDFCFPYFSILLHICFCLHILNSDAFIHFYVKKEFIILNTFFVFRVFEDKVLTVYNIVL